MGREQWGALYAAAFFHTGQQMLWPSHWGSWVRDATVLFEIEPVIRRQGNVDVLRELRQMPAERVRALKAEYGSETHAADAIWLRDLASRSEAASAEARRSSQVIAEMIEAVPDGFVKYGADRRIEYCNSAFSAFFPWEDGVVAPGALLDDILKYGVERGFYAGAGKRKEDQEAIV